MGDYKPKTSTGIVVNTVKELTSGAGVSVANIVKFVSSKVSALTSSVDIGDSTTPFKNLYVELINYGSAILQFASSGRLSLRLGHTGYSTGGLPTIFTTAKNTTSTSAVDWFSHTISSTNTEVMIRINMLTRDTTASTQCYEEATFTCSRAGSGAVAGSTSNLHRVGSQLVTLTMSVSGNDATVRIANTSGSNTLSTVALVQILGVSTSS